MICRKALTLSVLPVLYLLGPVASGQLPRSTPSTRELMALPLPTGPFSVGRVTVYWQDESRIEPLSATHEPRELMVDIWYPSESREGAHAAYLDMSGYERALGPEGFQKYFGEAAEAIRKGVQTHAA